jgi:serine/threonine protein kinase/Tol biopolymer transport system component
MTPERWKQVEALYHAAYALPAGERPAFLAESCPDDGALRREVESLLNEPDSGDRFLAAPALEMPVNTANDPVPMIGQSLGGYQLQALLGVGGMGEVYRARDTTLARDVAIKILPREFTSDANRLARFAREARMLAAVNHPGICAIYGFEEAVPSGDSGQAAFRFLILELVEGETLAAKLEGVSRRQSRPVGLSLDHALRIARQIADALEVAHEKGIVHRDLKPANITVTPDGVVKVLDFGLAKALGPADAGRGDDAPAGHTREGVVIGTAAYMSPEQARGLTVDKRTDIWAFGCVLYEMLTGRTAFAGDTPSDSIAKILEREPEWTALPVGTPTSIQRLLRRCLAKDPKKRFRDIGDVRIEIDAVDDVPPAPPRVRTARLPWLLAGALAAGLAGSVVLNLQRPLPAGGPVRFTEWLPPGQTLNGSRGSHMVSISPDGEHFVYSGAPLGLYLRTLTALDAKMIPGTETFEATGPVFSPDGRSIAFFTFSDQTIKRIDITGGVARTLCPAKPPTGMSWGREGIVFGQGQNIGQGQNTDAIKLVSPDTGPPTVLVRVNDGEWAHGPQILPGGEHILFTLAKGDAQNRWDRGQAVLQTLKTGNRREIIGEASDARYLPTTGHIVYALSGSVYAVTFDVRALATIGEPVRVIEGVRRATGNATGAAAFGVSATGTLVYVPGPAAAPGSAPMDLGLMNRKGEVEPLNLQPPGLYSHPAVSPDDVHVAFGSDDGKEDATIYTYKLAGGSVIQRLTVEGINRFPVWASDTRIAFQSDRGGEKAVWWQSLDRSPAVRLTTPERGTSHAPESWFGDTLLYSETKGSDVSLWTLSLSDPTPRRFDAAPSSALTNAVFSPDGRWVAYSSTRKAQMTLYVQRFPTGPRHQLRANASDTAKHPRWSRDGKELCYDPSAARFECARFTTEAFDIGTPVRVPKKLYLSPPGARTNYDLRRDGSFVGLITAGHREFVRGSDNQIHVVLNWLEELQARVPRR